MIEQCRDQVLGSWATELVTTLSQLVTQEMVYMCELTAVSSVASVRWKSNLLGYELTILDDSHLKFCPLSPYFSLYFK